MTMQWLIITTLSIAVIVLAAALVAFYIRWARARARAGELQARLRNLAEEMSGRPDPWALQVVGEAAYNPLILADALRQVIAINPAARALFGVETAGPGLSVMAVTRQHELDDLVEIALSEDEPIERQVEVQGRLYRARALARKTGQGRFAGLALEDIGELQRLGRARRDMVANISHELRTPITSIRLLVDTLLRGAASDRKQRDQMLTRIAAEADTLQQIAQELLDLAMIESGRTETRLVPVALREVSQRAIGRLFEQAERKSQTITDDIPADLRALADADQVERVLVNLLHNAIKFTAEGGTIWLASSADLEWTTVTVTDTGIGIPLAERERVFERFYRGDRARGRGGTGLGLAIAKHIIAAHGGRIWAESARHGQGARLCFTLPMVDEKPSADRGKRSAPPIKTGTAR